MSAHAVARRSLESLLLVALVAVACSAHAADAKRSGIADREAERLVQAALDAELTGDAAHRAELLAQALKLNPDHPAANWHSGRVRFDGQWRPLAEAQDLAKRDPRWREYRRLREELANDPAIDVELAQWCRYHGLPGEERYHWQRVLADDPQHLEARERLGLSEYQGELFTPEQIAAVKREAKEARAAFDRHKPLFAQLCRDATGRDEYKRLAAIEQLSSVTDPEAVPALEHAVQKASGDASPDAIREMNLAVVTSLSKMPQHEATVRLLDYAVFAGLPEVRSAAAAALKGRRPTDYVPQLMAALEPPIEVDVEIIPLAEGYAVTETIEQVGPESGRKHTRHTIYDVQRLNPNPRVWSPVSDVVGAKAMEQVTQTQLDVAVANGWAELQNARVQEVLTATTGLKGGDTPKSWWVAWQQFNELSLTDEVPIYSSAQAADYVFPTMSCFAAGTPVWTRSGPVAIDRIAVGDMVLAQHPETGEVDYRPVTETTVRPPSDVVSLKFGDETIVATLGHRFWVNGRGWEMAKFLAADTPLHALTRPLTLEQIGREEPQCEAFNLAVDEFHTYFVGQSQVLVHDNHCPRPTLAGVPGGKRPAAVAGDHPNPSAADDERTTAAR